mgnify:CR=1 FL=1
MNPKLIIINIKLMYQGIITSINTPDFRTAIEEINKIKDKTSQL